MSQESFEFQLEIQESKDSDKYIPVTVRFEKGEGGHLAARTFSAQAEEAEGRSDDEYDVSLVVRDKANRYGCWVCLNPPCPPNYLVWMNPCPPPE